MSDKKVTIKDLKKEVKDDKDVEYDLVIEEKENKDLPLKAGKGGEKIEITAKGKKKADKNEPANGTNKKVSAELKEKFISDDFEIKTLDTTLTLKEAISVSPKGISTFNLKFGGVIAIVLVVIIGAIGGGIASSKSEDKEEESL